MKEDKKDKAEAGKNVDKSDENEATFFMSIVYEDGEERFIPQENKFKLGQKGENYDKTNMP